MKLLEVKVHYYETEVCHMSKLENHKLIRKVHEIGRTSVT
jgi:hypothetical protein